MAFFFLGFDYGLRNTLSLLRFGLADAGQGNGGPDCNHSFDATCSLTAVPDSLFPGRVPVMLQGSGMPAAAADKKEPFSVIPEIAAEEKPEAAPESTEESAPDFADAAPQTPQADTAESTPKEAAAPEGEDQPRVAHETPAEAEPEKASAPAQKAEPAQSTQPEQPAPIAGVPLAKPETKLRVCSQPLPATARPNSKSRQRLRRRRTLPHTEHPRKPGAKREAAPEASF